MLVGHSFSVQKPEEVEQLVDQESGGGIRSFLVKQMRVELQETVQIVLVILEEKIIRTGGGENAKKRILKSK